MHGLPRAGILANKLPKKRLAKRRYFEIPHTSGLWKHVSRPISFTLVVGDFGIKYVGRYHAEYLIKSIKEDYTVKFDETGGLYCGIQLDWNYDARYLDISMPSYVKKHLTCYSHTPPKCRRYSPHDPAPVIFGKKAQELPPNNDIKPLDEKGKKRIRQAVGSFLYYGRAVYLTILMALNYIAGQQESPTEKTMKMADQFLDYMATNTEIKTYYHASYMILHCHSDASYLTDPKARSCARGQFSLASLLKDGYPIKLNGVIVTN